MESIKVTVIIPSYNDIEHVHTAVNSVLDQTYKNTEVIVIDDASTDNTYAYLKDRYGSKIKLLKHKINKKLGGARNTGLKHATGKYILFLDSDDWLEPETISTVLELAEKHKSEITAFGMNLVWSSGKQKYYHGQNLEVNGGIEAIKALSEYKIGSIATNKLFLKKFLEDNQIKFLENYWHEDVPFSIQAVFLCKHYFSIDTAFYNYLQQNQSITKRIPTILHLRSYLRLLIFIHSFTQKNLISTKLDDGNISATLLKAHFLNDVLPKLVRYKTLKPNDWEADLQEACKQELFENWATGFAILKDLTIDHEKANDTSIEESLKRAIEKKTKKVEYLGNAYQLAETELQRLLPQIALDKKESKKYLHKIKKLESEAVEANERLAQQTVESEKERSILVSQITILKNEIEKLQKENGTITKTLHEFYHSNLWKIARRYYILRDMIVPTQKAKK